MHGGGDVHSMSAASDARRAGAALSHAAPMLFHHSHSQLRRRPLCRPGCGGRWRRGAATRRKAARDLYLEIEMDTGHSSSLFDRTVAHPRPVWATVLLVFIVYLPTLAAAASLGLTWTFSPTRGAGSILTAPRRSPTSWSIVPIMWSMQPEGDPPRFGRSSWWATRNWRASVRRASCNCASL